MYDRAMRKRKTKTITIDSDLLKWIEEKIETKEFANLSHAIEKALYELRKAYEEK